MTREPWFENFVQTLEQLADPGAQRRAWVDRRGRAMESPTELICQLYDDSAVGDRLGRGTVFSPAADQILVEMQALIDGLELEQAPAALLADPRWLRFTALAHDALAAVRAAPAA